MKQMKWEISLVIWVLMLSCDDIRAARSKRLVPPRSKKRTLTKGLGSLRGRREKCFLRSRLVS